MHFFLPVPAAAAKCAFAGADIDFPGGGTGVEPGRERSQFRLRQRRFAPFFGVQFLGAMNDNVFKQALVLLLAYQRRPNAHRCFPASS